MKKTLPIMFIPEKLYLDKLQKFEEELLHTGIVSSENGRFYYEEEDEEIVLSTRDRIFIPNFIYNKQ